MRRREPFLLLADAQAPARAAQVALRQAVAQPAAGHADHLDVLRQQARSSSWSSRNSAASGDSAALDPAPRKLPAPAGRCAWPTAPGRPRWSALSQRLDEILLNQSLGRKLNRFSNDSGQSPMRAHAHRLRCRGLESRSATDPMKLAVFDLDHTLLAGDSDYLWGQFLVRSRAMSTAAAYERENRRFYEEYQAGTLDILKFCAFSAAAAVAAPAGDAARMAPPVPARKDRADHRRQARRRLLERHRAEGATPADHQRHQSLRHRADRRAAGRAAPDCHRPGDCATASYTGQVAGTPNFQGGKVTRLREWLAAQPQPTTAHDRPTATRATTSRCWRWAQLAVAVDPDDVLRAEARSAVAGSVISLRGDAGAPRAGRRRPRAGGRCVARTVVRVQRHRAPVEVGEAAAGLAHDHRQRGDVEDVHVGLHHRVDAAPRPAGGSARSRRSRGCGAAAGSGGRSSAHCGDRASVREIARWTCVALSSVSTVPLDLHRLARPARRPCPSRPTRSRRRRRSSRAPRTRPAPARPCASARSAIEKIG